MSFQIHFSPRASFEYGNVMDYVIFNFGMQTASEIEEDFDRLLNQISLNPKMYPLFDKRKKIRRCVISKQTSLYYRISGEYLEIVSFRGNLMNPNKINL
jgi:hypothetical protein